MKLCKSCGRVQYKAGATCFNCGSDEIVDTETYSESGDEFEISASVFDVGGDNSAPLKPMVDGEHEVGDDNSAPLKPMVDGEHEVGSDDFSIELNYADEPERASEAEAAITVTYDGEESASDAVTYDGQESVSDADSASDDDSDELAKALAEVEAALEAPKSASSAAEEEGKIYRGEFYQAVTDAPPPPWKQVVQPVREPLDAPPIPTLVPTPAAVAVPSPEPPSFRLPDDEPEPKREPVAKISLPVANKRFAVEDEYYKNVIYALIDGAKSSQIFGGLVMFALFSLIKIAVEVGTAAGEGDIIYMALGSLLSVPVILYGIGVTLCLKAISPRKRYPLSQPPALKLLNYAAVANIVATLILAVNAFLGGDGFAAHKIVHLLIIVFMLGGNFWIYIDVAKITNKLDALLTGKDYGPLFTPTLPFLVFIVTGLDVISRFFETAELSGGFGIDDIVGIPRLIGAFIMATGYMKFKKSFSKIEMEGKIRA